MNKETTRERTIFRVEVITKEFAENFYMQQYTTGDYTNFKIGVLTENFQTGNVDSRDIISNKNGLDTMQSIITLVKQIKKNHQRAKIIFY